MCYGYKMTPDAVLDMEFNHFMYLSNNLGKFREEEAAYHALAIWGRGEGEAEEVASYETPDDLRRLFGGV